MLQLEKILEYYRKKDYHLSGFGGLCPLPGGGGIAAKFYHPLISKKIASSSRLFTPIISISLSNDSGIIGLTFG